ncbi:hypothetical protein DM02DRAFT_622390 [Periconia macrospinosa]|uniref:Uncharacterized protein n=1 Tax=Periconia macrospinosa TaxID=97972 RepID=A0A2V1ECR2_9PLEO|nr:hypothetical protein DM02DRAFT_622390 [Periconia macrospinosa]
MSMFERLSPTATDGDADQDDSPYQLDSPDQDSPDQDASQPESPRRKRRRSSNTPDPRDDEGREAITAHRPRRKYNYEEMVAKVRQMHDEVPWLNTASTRPPSPPPDPAYVAAMIRMCPYDMLREAVVEWCRNSPLTSKGLKRIIHRMAGENAEKRRREPQQAAEEDEELV